MKVEKERGCSDEDVFEIIYTALTVCSYDSLFSGKISDEYIFVYDWVAAFGDCWMCDILHYAGKMDGVGYSCWHGIDCISVSFYPCLDRS